MAFRYIWIQPQKKTQSKSEIECHESCSLLRVLSDQLWFLVSLYTSKDAWGKWSATIAEWRWWTSKVQDGVLQQADRKSDTWIHFYWSVRLSYRLLSNACSISLLVNVHAGTTLASPCPSVTRLNRHCCNPKSAHLSTRLYDTIRFYILWIKKNCQSRCLATSHREHDSTSFANSDKWPARATKMQHGPAGGSQCCPWEPWSSQSSNSQHLNQLFLTQRNGFNPNGPNKPKLGTD